MKKTDKKTTVLRIFKKSDGEKAYLLERDGFYELREGKEDSLWKNLDVILEEGDPLFLRKRKVTLSVELFKKAAPLGPVPEAKEFYFTSCDSRKVPSSYSMDEAIRETEGKEKRLLKILEKKDGRKAYLLERDGFYEFQEGKVREFWKNANVTSEDEGFKLSFVGVVSRDGDSPTPEAIHVWREDFYKTCIIIEVSSSFTMEEAIRKFGGEDEKSFTKTLTEDEGKAYEEAMKDFRIPEGAFDDLHKWVTGEWGSYEKVTGSLTEEGKDIPIGTVYGTYAGEFEPFTTKILAKSLSKDELASLSTATAAELSASTCATSRLKVGGVEVAEPIYAESFLPHLVKTKDEGVRRDIEADTIVIDRGVAVSQGLIREEDGKKKHADVIMGLKVKYAKEGILPMDSAFVIFKEKGAKDEKKTEVAEKSDKDAIMDDCRALGTINREDLKDMSIDELFTLEENLTHALMTIAHTRKERYDAREGASEELSVKLSKAFAEASFAEAKAEAKAEAAELEKEEKKAKEDKKAAADVIVDEALEKGGITFYYSQVRHPVGTDVEKEKYIKGLSGELEEMRIFVPFKDIDKLDIYVKKKKVTEVRIEFSDFRPDKDFPIFAPEGRKTRSFKSATGLDRDDEDKRIFEVEVCDKVLVDALVDLQFNHTEVFPWGKGAESPETDEKKISEPTPYDLLGSVKIDPALWREGLSSTTKFLEATKKTKEFRESERSLAIRRGSIYIPMDKVSGDIPEELICHSSDDHAGEIEIKFSDVSNVEQILRECLSDDEKGNTLQQEEWLIYVKVYHEDDLDECILRVASGDVDEMVNLICTQRGLICKIIILHDNSSAREELKVVKTFSPSTGKITMDIEIEDLLPW